MGSVLELEKQVAELKQKLLTHELATGLLLTDIIRILDISTPGAADRLLDRWNKAEEKRPETEARNDPHTADAFKRIIKIVEMAMKK